RLRGLDSQARELVERYGWPGNVRELEMTMIRAVVFAAGPWITARDLRLPVAGPSDPALSARQQRIVLLVRHHGPVSCRDVAARVGISHETARVELSARVGVAIVR